MKKLFLSLVLFSLPLVSQASFLGLATTSDIKNLQEQLDTLSSALQTLKALIGNPLFGSITQPIAGTTYNLSGSGVTGSATSIGLQSLTIPQTGRLITTADLSTTFYVTLEPGSRVSQEIVSCTGVTQNANLTATLTGCTRGLLPVPPYTASTTYQFSHAGGTGLIFSNPPQFYNNFLAKDTDATITASFLFPAPTQNKSAATKDYVDGIVFSGSSAVSSTPGTSGYVRIATRANLGNGTPSTSQVYTVAESGSFSSSSLGSLSAVTTNAIGKIDTTFFDTSTSPLNTFGKPANVQTFTATGTSVWTRPSSASAVYVRVWGAGGSGGKWAGASGSGGGGGAYSESWFVASDTAATANVIVGAGGFSSTTDSNGLPGGQSSFGTSTYYVVAFGGAGGNGTTTNDIGGGGGGGQQSVGSRVDGAEGGNGGSPRMTNGSSTSVLLGNGGNGGAGQDNMFGGAGGGAGSVSAQAGGLSIYGGGGGGGANNSGNGGAGGASTYGGGGGGGYSNAGGAGGASVYGGNGSAGATAAASAGSTPGGGGGGSRTASGAGGNGKVVIITYF